MKNASNVHFMKDIDTLPARFTDELINITDEFMNTMTFSTKLRTPIQALLTSSHHCDK